MSDEVPKYAWLLWGRLKDGEGQPKPLGCYATREVALEAEELHKAHENFDRWTDVWVTPWPLATKPVVNFRMRYCSLTE